MASKTEKTLEESLLEVQSKLKAPKGLRNTFGNYNYRSTEGILEAVKPLLKEEGLTLKLSDSLEAIGDRYYVKATATLKKGSEIEEASAYAREEEIKKGMDSSQITGTSSSYARKYALNGLFLIDDTKDPDTDEYRNQTSKGTTKTAAPSAPSKPTNDKPYLNKGTESYDKVVKALTEKKATLDQVQLKYRLSSVVRAELEKIS